VQRHISNYTLPERSQCWNAGLGSVVIPSTATAKVPQAFIEGMDFDTVSVTTTYDSSAPSFALPHDRRRNLDWTNEQRTQAERGEEVKDIDDLQLKVSGILSAIYILLNLKFNSCKHFTPKVVRRRMHIFAYLCRPSQGE
jgi:hypothetical protein